MGGELIALLRLLHLRGPLVETVSSADFTNLRIFQGLAGIILNPYFWKYAFLLARVVYPLMRILQLADKKMAAMDMLYYFVLQADCILPKYLAEAEKFGETWMSEEVKEILDTKTNAASIHYEEEEEDSDDKEDEPAWEGGYS